MLRKQVGVFHTGERPNYELMLDIVSYLRDYSDLSHHPREDVAFRHLATHCPDLSPVLARLNQEHRIIARAGETLRDLLQGIVDGAIVSREALEVAAATYLVYYGNHIAKEEEDVLSRAAQSLTNSDWEDVRKAVPPMKDPLAPGSTQERYKELRRLIALEA